MCHRCIRVWMLQWWSLVLGAVVVVITGAVRDGIVVVVGCVVLGVVVGCPSWSNTVTSPPIQLSRSIDDCNGVRTNCVMN